MPLHVGNDYTTVAKKNSQKVFLAISYKDIYVQQCERCIKVLKCTEHECNVSNIAWTIKPDL